MADQDRLVGTGGVNQFTGVFEADVIVGGGPGAYTFNLTPSACVSGDLWRWCNDCPVSSLRRSIILGSEALMISLAPQRKNR